jgi:hypothetical protein
LLVDEGVAIRVLGRELRDFPPPDGNVHVSTPELGSGVLEEEQVLIGVDADDVRPEVADGAVLVERVALSARRAVIEEGAVGNPGGTNSAEHQSCGLADAQLRTEIACDVDPVEPHAFVRSVSSSRGA